MTYRDLRLVAPAALALWFALPSPARACSCTGPHPISEALAYSDAVFVAEIVSVQRTESFVARAAVTIRGLWAQALNRPDPYVQDWFRSPRFGLRVEAKVIEAFKGSVGSSVRLHTAHDGDSCGFPFVRAGTYVVFAKRQEDPLEKGSTFLTVSVCGMTRRLEEAGEAIEELKSLTAVERK